LKNERFSHKDLANGLYEISRLSVEQEEPAYVVVALDPVNFEKVYTRELEGVSTVSKSTPPDRNGQARLTSGYPAMTYANWFSYQTDFLSENLEINAAIANTRSVLSGYQVR